MRIGTALALAVVSSGVALSPAYLPDQWSVIAKMSIDRLANAEFFQPTRSVASNDVRNALLAASEATGVDFAYLAAEAALESGLDPKAKARTSSASGLFQFIDSTWVDMVERHGPKIGLAKEAAALASGDMTPAERRRIMDLRFNPGVAARMGAEFAAENRDYLKTRLGREPEDVDLYLAHFLGPGGAAKFLTRAEATPTAKAADAFPAAAKANRAVFYAGARARSFDEIRDRFEAKLADRADALGDIPARPAGPKPALRPTPETAVVPLAALDRDARPAGGDPYLSTLMTAQLAMNDSLSRVRLNDGSQTTSDAFRSLL